MKRVGITLALIMAAWLPVKALAAGGGSSYMLHATIAHKKNGSIVITANSPRPLSQALTALNREYGWVVDYEEGRYNSRQMVRYDDKHHQLIGGAFQAELPEPRTGTEVEETSILQQLVNQYNHSIGRTMGPLFRLVHLSSSDQYDVISRVGGASYTGHAYTASRGNTDDRRNRGRDMCACFQSPRHNA